MTSLRVPRVPCAIVLLAWLALSAPGCSDDKTPTNPSGVPNATGVFTGTYRIRTCADEVNGVLGTVCTPLLAATAPRQPLRLSLQQTNDQLLGNLQFSGWYTRSLTVTGTINPDGVIVLSGQTTFTETTCPTVTNNLIVNPFNTVLNRTLDGMTGDFRFTGTVRISTTACTFVDVVIEADSVQLTK